MKKQLEEKEIDNDDIFDDLDYIVIMMMQNYMFMKNKWEQI